MCGSRLRADLLSSLDASCPADSARTRRQRPLPTAVLRVYFATLIMADDKDVYSFYKISDLSIPLRIKVSSLVGKLPRHSRLELLEHPQLSLLGSEVSYVNSLGVRILRFSLFRGSANCTWTGQRFSRSVHRISPLRRQQAFDAVAAHSLPLIC